LLSLAAGRYIINGNPLAFGEGNVKERIKNVLNYKKPGIWMILISIIIVAAIVIGLASNPVPMVKLAAIHQTILYNARIGKRNTGACRQNNQPLWKS